MNWIYTFYILEISILYTEKSYFKAENFNKNCKKSPKSLALLFWAHNMIAV